MIIKGRKKNLPSGEWRRDVFSSETSRAGVSVIGRGDVFGAIEAGAVAETVFAVFVALVELFPDDAEANAETGGGGGSHKRYSQTMTPRAAEKIKTAEEKRCRPENLIGAEIAAELDDVHKRLRSGST